METIDEVLSVAGERHVENSVFASSEIKSSKNNVKDKEKWKSRKEELPYDCVSEEFVP